MKIAYDVAIMTQLVAACQTANEQLQKAESLVQEVHSHNDWTCKEKDRIDDLMLECKKLIKNLCESQKGFFHAVKLVSDDLADVEKNISGLFGGVESLLGKILAIPVKTFTIAGGGLISALFGNSGSGGSTTHVGSSGTSHGGGGGRVDETGASEGVPGLVGGPPSLDTIMDQLTSGMQVISGSTLKL